MDEPHTWGTQRSIILLSVLALHLATLALLVAASRTRTISASAERSIELMLFPPTKIPKVRAENIRPQRLSTDIAIALAPPTFNSSSQSGSSSAPDGRGSAVNWAAEAHRAVRAFEIRKGRPPNSAISVSSSWDEWWPGEHHAGDQFKTDSGDWIVWINADCYQVASWHSSAPTFGASPPPTICRGESGAPRGN
jgi:hypothetical protein